VFGDSAGWAAVAAGLAALIERKVEGARAEPALAAQDQAAGVVRAGARGPGWAVTIFMVCGHQVVRRCARAWARR
jgi:hypothetical protein